MSALVSRASGAISTGKFALQALGAAGADRRQTLRNALEREQAEANLQRRGQQQRAGEHGEGRADDAVEAEHLFVDLGSIARHLDQITAIIAKVDVALDEAQPHILGTLRIALSGSLRRAPKRPCCRAAAAN